ncbi:unnamed protein product [Rotaria socialis]|uniref:VCBS repeat-containing protein n=1 Tax=Rotaria socialis TaxID=392032 RepID=A0A820GLY7_9BILA|nr:unnamed protein product [Rotaria socialis]
MIVISDLNDDNVLDIAVASIGFDVVGVFFGYVDVSVIEQTAYSTRTGSDLIAVAIEDFNTDNKLDIVVVDFLDGNIVVLLQNGSRPFQSMSMCSTGEYSTLLYLTIADLNNDNHLDIIVINCGYDNIGVYYLDMVMELILLGYANGNFSIRASYSTGDLSGPPSIAIADFNRDCFLGIAVANWNSKDVVLLYGKGDSTFEKPYSYLMGYGSVISTVAIDDFNRDNWTDISVANYGTSHTGIRLQTCDNI